MTHSIQRSTVKGRDQRVIRVGDMAQIVRRGHNYTWAVGYIVEILGAKKRSNRAESNPHPQVKVHIAAGLLGPMAVETVVSSRSVVRVDG
jgi:hypothetical protein